jgi:NADH dehydrogenase FAD-containing subunit
MTTVLTRCFREEKPLVPKAVPHKKRVLIVGGRFAGIAAARALKRADIEIMLLDRRNHHIFQPFLSQAATAVLAPSEIATPIRQLEAKQKNFSVMLADVTGISLAARTVEAICRPFRYRSKGNMAVVGNNFAVLQAGHLRNSGFLTWLAWAALHVLTLPQLQNRFRVQTQWFWSYLTGQRSSRLISETQGMDIFKQTP